MFPTDVIRSIWHWWTGKHPCADNRLMRVPEYAAIERRIAAARAKHKPVKVYQQQKKELVTGLLGGTRSNDRYLARQRREVRHG